MSYFQKEARELAEKILSDPLGISESTYRTLDSFLVHYDLRDILDQVRFNAMDNRFYIPEDEEPFPLVPLIECDLNDDEDTKPYV